MKVGDKVQPRYVEPDEYGPWTVKKVNKTTCQIQRDGIRITVPLVSVRVVRHKERRRGVQYETHRQARES